MILLMSNIGTSSKPPVQFPYLRAAVSHALLKIQEWSTPNLPHWSVPEASAYAANRSHFPLCHPVPLLQKTYIFRLLRNQIQRPILVMKYWSLPKESRRGKKISYNSPVKKEGNSWCCRNKVRPKNACTVRWQVHRNGGKGRWDQKPSAMHVGFGIGQAAFFQSIVQQQALPLFHHCTLTHTRRL